MARESDTASRRHSRADRGDRGWFARWWWLILIVAVAVATAVVIAIVQQGSEEPQPRPTVTGPAPSPAIEPSPRETADPVAQALPDGVLRYAVTSQEDISPAGDMLGGFRLVYSDGDAEFVLEARQWRDAAHAQAAAREEGAEVAGGEERDVLVAGDSAGTAWVGPGAAVWSNGSLLLTIEAPADDAEELFDAFPL